MRIVDAHHHLWDLDAVEYPWLMERGVTRFFGDPAPIQQNYLVDDLRRDAQDFELTGTVHVQVGAAPGAEIAETRWLQARAEKEGLPSAIIAYCELERHDLEQQLDAHCAADRLRGVRQIVGRSAEEDARTGSGTLLEDLNWISGLTRLAERDLSFDLQLVPGQMMRMADIIAEVPGLRVALCHCGSPWDQSADGIAAWRDGLRALAASGNVHCKVSGLAMFDHDWTIGGIRPLVESCLEIFGAARCMFGSNFPVDKLHKPYNEIWRSYDVLTSHLPESDRNALFVDNARVFYRLLPCRRVHSRHSVRSPGPSPEETSSCHVRSSRVSRPRSV